MNSNGVAKKVAQKDRRSEGDVHEETGEGTAAAEGGTDPSENIGAVEGDPKQQPGRAAGKGGRNVCWMQS